MSTGDNQAPKATFSRSTGTKGYTAIVNACSSVNNRISPDEADTAEASSTEEPGPDA